MRGEGVAVVVGPVVLNLRPLACCAVRPAGECQARSPFTAVPGKQPCHERRFSMLPPCPPRLYFLKLSYAVLDDATQEEKFDARAMLHKRLGVDLDSLSPDDQKRLLASFMNRESREKKSGE